MAASGDFELDNEDGFDPEDVERTRTGMVEQMKHFLTRSSKDDKAKNKVLPAQKGEWVCFTKDFSKKCRVERAQWVVCPHSPGSKGQKNLDECIEEALFAMKCLLRGKMYAPGQDREDADVFEKLEPFVYTLGIKQKAKGDDVSGYNKVKSGKGVPCFVLINCGDDIIGCASMDMNLVGPKERMQWSQSKESIRKCFTELKQCNFITFDGIQSIQSKTVKDQIQSNKDKLAI